MIATVAVNKSNMSAVIPPALKKNPENNQCFC